MAKPLVFMFGGVEIPLEDRSDHAQPAYLTDFSPNGAVPRERDIPVGNPREQIRKLLAEFRSEYIVKGWAPA